MNAEILIVEDEGLIALDLQKKVEQAGYKVLATADNAEDALRETERLQPSLVFMDIRLRGEMDGVDTADQIRRRFHLPVIFVTAHADRETLNRARITEPFGYIVKPFHAIDFRVQIEVALWKHKMEQKLRVSEEWLSATFRNVADALITTDTAGNIVLMNRPACDLTGWSDAKGLPFLDVFRISDEATGRPITESVFRLADMAQTMGFMPIPFILTRRGYPEPAIIEAEFSVNRDEGKTFGVIVAFRDITARRNAERQQRQIQKMNALTLMATGLGRELAESQNRMDESIKFLIEQSTGETSRMLWDIYEHSANQQAIVQQLMTLGRTDAGAVVEVDLNRLLPELQDQMEKALGPSRGLTLHLQPNIPIIHVDPRHFRENLLRLIADARQATAKGGWVEVATAATDGSDGKSWVQVTIRDNRKTGAGSKDRAFDPYYQSLPGKRNPGFSLALVCQFVALSGGSIEVESVPGESSAYILRFPAASGVPAHSEPVEALPIALSA